uniref:Uncharacterized protein n=1 Tax=Molossus molossus TaxID=27622 RepID=A0A7J8HHG3_MOLMO|nr:hypothetical protein HJG59_011082 [Molossus molossus]
MTHQHRQAPSRAHRTTQREKRLIGARVRPAASHSQCLLFCFQKDGCPWVCTSRILLQAPPQSSHRPTSEGARRAAPPQPLWEGDLPLQQEQRLVCLVSFPLRCAWSARQHSQLDRPGRAPGGGMDPSTAALGARTGCASIGDERGAPPADGHVCACAGTPGRRATTFPAGTRTAGPSSHLKVNRS